MEKYQLLKLATKDYNEIIKDKPNSAFGLVNNLLRSACITEMDELKRKDKMEKNLLNIFMARDKTIAGCKMQDVRDIIQTVFGISSAKGSITKNWLKEMSSDEICLYFHYIVRIAKSSISLKKQYQDEDNLLKREKKEIELRRKKEEQEREKERLNQMTFKEQVRYNIETGIKSDIDYYQELDENSDERIIIAGILKEYWILSKKWSGVKPKSKQAQKVKKVKEILDEV